MERTPSCELCETSIRVSNDGPDYAEPRIELGEAPIILGPRAATACSTDYIETIVDALPAEKPALTRDLAEAPRLLDLSVAWLILLFVLPLMLFCAVAIALSSRGPVIYRQVRIGQGGREFTCFKFRTMTNSAAASLQELLADESPHREEWASLYKLRSDPRVTPLGRFLRRYSLDELPQLINVILGDMSVVGPRPIVADEIHRYGDHFADYCSVKPGITGLWQVSGRHALTYAERVRLDAEYANNKSTRLDLLILWRTVPVVFFGQNN